MVKGKGRQSATAAVPQLREHTESSKQRKVWKVLFDSGSDGDIAFIHKSNKASIEMQTRLHPQRWKTSNGTFETNKVGVIKSTLPRFSANKVMSVTPDIKFIEKPPPPIYDLIIGLETLAHWKAILNFHESTVTIDHIKLPMQSLGDPSDAAQNNIYKEAQEPSISCTATKRVTKILDAKYDKANLPEIVN